MADPSQQRPAGAAGRPAGNAGQARPQAKLWTRDFVSGTLINFLLMVNYYGLMVVVADYAMRQYGAPASLAGLAASIFIIGALIARLVSGRVMDLVGRKRLLLIGAAAEVVFSLLYLAGIGFELLFALRLLHGIAYGACSTTIGTVVTSLVPNSRKGEGVGYYMLSVTLGAAVGPFLGMFLTQFAGFQAIFVVAAGVAAVCLATVAQLRAPEARPAAGAAAAKAAPAKDEAKVVPAEGGVEAAPAAAASDGGELAGGGSPAPDGAPAGGGRPAPDASPASGPRAHRPSLANYLELDVVPISAVCALLFFGYSSLLTFLTPFAAENGLSTPASFFFVVYALATFATRPFTGRLFDRKGDRVVMVPSFVAFVCGMALLATVHQAPAMLIAAALLGFGVGTVQSSGLALAVRIAPDSRIGLANSTFYIMLDVGVGIGPLLLGIVQPLWGYRGLFAAMAGLAVVALAAYLLVSRKGGKMRRLLR